MFDSVAAEFDGDIEDMIAVVVDGFSSTCGALSSCGGVMAVVECLVSLCLLARSFRRSSPLGTNSRF